MKLQMLAYATVTLTNGIQCDYRQNDNFPAGIFLKYVPHLSSKSLGKNRVT